MFHILNRLRGLFQLSAGAQRAPRRPFQSKPYGLIAELTYRCPLRCPYCSNPLELAKFAEELNTATWSRVIRQAAELGVVQIHFTGGEPLVRKDLPELVRVASKVGLYSHLITAGVTADAHVLGELRAAGLDALQISFQDTRREGNDWLAGGPWFEKKRAAFAAAKRLGFAVTLNIVVHRYNLDHIQEVFALADELEADRVEIAHVQYTGWAFQNRSALLPSREQVRQAVRAVELERQRSSRARQIVHVLPDYFQEFPKACMNGWGRVFLTINPDGAILPCQTARCIPELEFPHVFTDSLHDAWHHSEAFQRFRGTDWLPEPCRSCERREIDFGGCRCQAFLLTGNAQATDPVCQLSPDHQLVRAATDESERRNRPPIEFRHY